MSYDFWKTGGLNPGYDTEDEARAAYEAQVAEADDDPTPTSIPDDDDRELEELTADDVGTLDDVLREDDPLLDL